MASKLLSLIVSASTGAAISALGRVGSALGALGGNANSAAGGMGSLAGQITQGIVQANLLGFAFGKVQQGMGFMNGKFEEAKQLQLENITAATTFSSLTGQSYQQGADFIDSLNQRLAISAAALPGSTQDYKNLATGIQDNVLPAFKDLKGALDMKGFENSVVSLSESYGALAAASNVPIANLKLGLTKALGGAGVASLRQIQFFEQNAVILNEIESRLGKLGKKSLADLNIKDRVKLLEEVGKKFITEDFKQQAGRSVDGLIQSFKSTIFDPSSGIFGLMRDLDPNTKGAQSAFAAFNDVLDNLIGGSGLFTQLTNLFAAAGIKFIDPMQILRNGFLLFNQGLQFINKLLADTTAYLGAIGAGANWQDGLRYFVSTLQLRLGGIFNQAGSSISSVLNTFDLANVSTNISNFFKGLGNLINIGISNLVNFTKSVVSTVDFFYIGVQIGAFLGTLVGSIIALVQTVDWNGLINVAGTAIFGIVQALAGFFFGYYGTLIPQMPGMFANGLGIIIGALGAVIGGVIGLVVQGWTLIFQSIGQFAVEQFQSLGQWANSAFESMTQTLIGAINSFIKFINDAISKLNSIPGMNIGSIATVAMPLGSSAGSGTSAPLAPQESLASPAPALNLLNLGGGVAKFKGHIPNAANGLLAAAYRESQNMPSGAQLVVANNREFILQPAGNAPRSSGGNTINVNININGAAGDLKAIARAVVAEIQTAFDAELQGQLI
jgi:hypothetical protein